MTGTVADIHLAAGRGDPVAAVESVEAVAGRGLRGDRYFGDEGAFDGPAGADLTLIERETVAAVEREYDIAVASGAHRRNVTTRGVALDSLVGERFAVGGAVCEGVELCEPCSYLEHVLGVDGVVEALVGRGGLRARVVDGGRIRVGDEVSRR